MTLRVSKAGRILIRIPYSPWLSVVDEHGKSQPYEKTKACLMATPEDVDGDKWTVLHAPKPGTYRVAAPYQLPRGTPCPAELKQP